METQNFKEGYLYEDKYRNLYMLIENDGVLLSFRRVVIDYENDYEWDFDFEEWLKITFSQAEKLGLKLSEEVLKGEEN